MRSSFLAACGCLLMFSATLRGQVAWNFGPSGGPSTTAPASLPANISGGTISSVNGASAVSETSGSNVYPGASGGFNLAITTRTGGFDAADSTYLQFTLSAAAGFAVRATGLSVGTRSTATGPLTLLLYSSADNFTTVLGTTTVSGNSTWSRVTLPAFVAAGTSGGSITFRIYGANGVGNTGANNWRVDDLSLTASAVVAPMITNQPTSATIVSAQTATFSVSATGTGTLSYQWRKNGASISGNLSALTPNLDLGAVLTSASGTYDVVVTDSLARTISSPATLTVNKAPATVTVSNQTTTYNGIAQASTGGATTPAGLPLSYSYTATGGTVFGPSSSAPVNAGTYSVTATVNHSEYQGSGTGTFTINKAPAAITLGALAVNYDGAPHAATATTSPPGISTSITYDGANFAPFNAGSYNVVATISHPNYTGSATGTLVISPTPVSLTLGGLAAVYNGSPRAATATTDPAGQTVTLTYTGVNGTSYGPTTTPPTNAGTYSVSGVVNGGNFAGNAAATFVIAPAPQTIAFSPPDQLSSTGSFPLLATSSSGLPVSFALLSGTPAIATLAGHTITLTGTTGPVTVRATQAGDANHLAAPAVDRTFNVVASATAPTITLQPVDTVGYLGQPVSITAAASGAPAPTYQWRKHGTDIPGATNSTFTIVSPTAADSGIYQVVATNAAGSATSAAVALTVGKRPQSITFPEPAAVYPSGNGVPLSASASSGLPVSLNLVSGSASISGVVLTGSGGAVVVRATQEGDANFDPAEPVERTFNFVSGGTSPFITVVPPDQSVNAGAALTVRAAAIGTPSPTYQWQKDGVDLPGATSANLAFNALTPSDSGRYTIVATNAFGTARASFTLTVLFAPTILAHPATQTVFAGDAVTLSVDVAASPIPTFQWRRNGTAIAGATRSTYTLANAATNNSGRYDVVVTNSLGSITSESATLTVESRNFPGAYFGRFGGAANATGEFALFVRPDNTAVFLGHLPGQQTGIITLSLRLNLDGEFSLNLLTAASEPDLEHSATLETTPLRAAAPRPVTLRGSVNSENGSVTGTVAELGVTFEGTRPASSGPSASRSGVYRAAAVGSAAGLGHAIVGPDGQALFISTDGVNLDSVKGTLTAEGRLTGTTIGGTAVDVGFNNGALSGTARTTAGATITLAGATESLAGMEHLVNLSVRGTTSGVTPLITGFVITGTTNKQVLIRAAGPSLTGAPFNVTNALADPTIQVFRGNNTTAGQNDDWGTPAGNVAALNAATARAGAFPFRTGSGDAALLATLAPGPYTVLIAGGNGAVLAEIYEVLQANETPGLRRLGNLSARGMVAPGAPLIAGLVISGTAPQRVLIRAIGPTLGTAPFNVPGALANPQLTLFRGTTVLRNNDDWFRDADMAALIRAAATRAAAFPLGAQSLDAAVLLYLEPGAYTVQISGPANATGAAGTGTALVEVYEAVP